MDNNLEKSVIIYRSEDGSVQLEVQLYEETLWLNVHQMSQLFGRDEKTVRKHINNALKEELCGAEVVANFATTTKHNSQYQPITIEYFNKSHDRFLIIDNDVYLNGGSIKDLGKKVSTFVKMSIPKVEFLDKLLNKKFLK